MSDDPTSTPTPEPSPNPTPEPSPSPAPTPTPSPTATEFDAGKAFEQLAAGLPDDLKPKIEAKGFKDLGQVLAHLDATEKFVGADKNTLLRAPKAGRDEAPEDWKAFEAQLAQTLGAPESPDQYPDYTPPEGVENPVAPELVKAFQAKAHERGGALAAPETISAALDIFHDMNAEAMKQMDQAYQEETRAGREALKAKLGKDYDKRLEAGRQHLTALDGGEDLAGLLKESGLDDHPAFLSVVADLAARMGEAGPEGGGAGGAGFTMTADQAKAEIAKLEGDPKTVAALQNKSHPEHKTLNKKRADLYAAAYPGS